MLVIMPTRYPEVGQGPPLGERNRGGDAAKTA